VPRTLRCPEQLEVNGCAVRAGGDLDASLVIASDGTSKLAVILAALLELAATSEPTCCLLDHDPEAWRDGVATAVGEATSARPELRRQGHVYEVGVFTGNSMVHLARQLNPPMMWGFDSFEGLPDSTEEYVSEWHAGKVSLTKKLRRAFARGAWMRTRLAPKRGWRLLLLNSAHMTLLCARLLLHQYKDDPRQRLRHMDLNLGRHGWV